MASTVDICNMALSLLGDEATVTSINPADGSDQAGHCARWYPVAVRRMLESANWSFATKRKKLSRLSNTSAALYDSTAFMYALPSDCVRVVRLDSEFELAASKDCNGHFYKLALSEDNKTRALFTSVDDPVLEYVSYVTTTELFPAYFTDALVVLLAAYLTGPMKRTDSTSNTAINLMQQYENLLNKAVNADAAGSVERKQRYRASQLRAREV